MLNPLFLESRFWSDNYYIISGQSLYNTVLVVKNLYFLRIMADRRAHNLFDLIFFFSDLELVSKSENFGKSTVKMLEPFCNILFTFISLFQIN